MNFKVNPSSMDALSLSQHHTASLISPRENSDSSASFSKGEIVMNMFLMHFSRGSPELKILWRQKIQILFFMTEGSGCSTPPTDNPFILDLLFFCANILCFRLPPLPIESAIFVYKHLST